MGRTEDGGLGWPPSEFWNATVYDIERALASMKRRSSQVTREEAEDMKLRILEAQQQEADQRAASGDTRSHRQIIEEMTALILNEGKQ